MIIPRMAARMLMVVMMMMRNMQPWLFVMSTHVVGATSLTMSTARTCYDLLFFFTESILFYGNACFKFVREGKASHTTLTDAKDHEDSPPLVKTTMQLCQWAPQSTWVGDAHGASLRLRFRTASPSITRLPECKSTTCTSCCQ